MVEKVTAILFGSIMLVILLLVAFSQTATGKSEADRLKDAGSLPGCCLRLASPINGACSSADRDILAFKCDVPIDVSPTGKLEVKEVFKRVNRVDTVSADQIRQTCQCSTTAT